ncbi:replication protein [Cypionkella aquatica]|uniref:Replication protein n=1 Tax=Cypionkella aquatica TaxID=1756042 RepID=A0AA37X682_9RHOB|nr:ParB/RepB/Spo0J family partition protein [Cypionkella aquatica]GLS88776.1 replication protein [Cypionkella aquatica]
MSITRPFTALPIPPVTAEQPPAHTPDAPRPQGQEILFIPLDAITTTKLKRDRACHIDPEIDDLKASILATGLSNPIRIDTSRPGQFELVQGWRRLSAFRALYAETGLACFAEIAAIPVADFTPVDQLYRRMVDENLVRKNLSWAEMGRIATIYCYDRATACTTLDEAIDELFASTSRQRRNYVRHFAELMVRLEKVLEFPEAIPRALGVSLNQALKHDSSRSAALHKALRACPDRDAAAELEILRLFAAEIETPQIAAQLSPRGQARSPHTAAKPRGEMLRLTLLGGAVTCTIAPGEIALQLDRDFTQTPRNRLETAIAAFCAALG